MICSTLGPRDTGGKTTCSSSGGGGVCDFDGGVSTLDSVGVTCKKGFFTVESIHSSYSKSSSEEYKNRPFSFGGVVSTRDNDGVTCVPRSLISIRFSFS